MILKTNYNDFMIQLDSLKFKDKDEIEAKQFGCKNVLDCYKKIKEPRFAKYYLILDNRTNSVLSPIVLQRDGFIIFFVTKDLNNSNMFSFVKEIKKLAKDTINKCGSIFVKTIYWYKEAHKLDKLVGFKPYKINDLYTVYVMDK